MHFHYQRRMIWTFIYTSEKITWDGLGWIKGNVGQKGFYRVNYDDKNWDALASAFKTNHKVKHVSLESLCKLWFQKQWLNSFLLKLNEGLKCLLYRNTLSYFGSTTSSINCINFARIIELSRFDIIRLLAVHLRFYKACLIVYQHFPY